VTLRLDLEYIFTRAANDRDGRGLLESINIIQFYIIDWLLQACMAERFVRATHSCVSVAVGTWLLRAPCGPTWPWTRTTARACLRAKAAHATRGLSRGSVSHA
jgi:hypothetical protein